jgi:hypothetical protein
MNEERTGKCLRQDEHICGHLWHRYSITVNQIMVATVKLSKWCVTNNYIYPIYRNHNPVLSSFMTYHWVCNKSNTTGATCRVGTVCSSGFEWGSWCSIFYFLCNVLQIARCPSFLFLLAIVLSVFWLPICIVNRNSICIVNRNYSAILATLQITSYDKSHYFSHVS